MNSRKHCAVTPLLAVLLAATAVALSAYGADDDNTDTVTTPASSVIERPLEHVDGAPVGQVEGSEMFIAVLSDGANVRAYLCNGTVDDGTLDLWFEGSWTAAEPSRCTDTVGPHDRAQRPGVHRTSAHRGRQAVRLHRR